MAARTRVLKSSARPWRGQRHAWSFSELYREILTVQQNRCRFLCRHHIATPIELSNLRSVVQSVCWFTSAFHILQCHPSPCMLLSLRFHADSNPSLSARSFNSNGFASLATFKEWQFSNGFIASSVLLVSPASFHTGRVDRPCARGIFTSAPLAGFCMIPTV